MEFISKSVEETAKIAFEFAQSLKNSSEAKAAIVGLYGELGSGKTTFMKYLAESLGVKEAIKSPTFVIMKKYQFRDANRETLAKDNQRLAPSAYKLLIHIDAYRIEKSEEMLNLNWQEIISDPKNLICVEWPEKIAGIMPKHTMITFEHVSENQRKISIA